MSKKVAVTLSDELMECVEQYMNENGCSSVSKAVAEMVKRYVESNNEIAEQVVEKLDEKYKNMFTRIRLGSTMADKNAQVLIECLNAIAFKWDIKPMATDAHETELVEDSKKVVKERIENFKQKKDWKKSGSES